MEGLVKPKLIEPGASYFIGETLKRCQYHKTTLYNNYFNIILAIVFFIILAIFLIYKYKGKLSEKERKEKEREKENYILQRINVHKKNVQKERNENITGLPEFEHINDYFVNKYFK